MKRMLALCFICFGLNGQDKETIKVPTCFVTAETYLALPEGDRLTYTAGLMDGFYASEIFSGNKAAACHVWGAPLLPSFNRVVIRAQALGRNRTV